VKRRYYIIYISVPILAGLLYLLSWNTLRLYRFEKKQVSEKVEACIKDATDTIQNYNGSILNNYASMLTDNHYEEKVAFAAGFTHNMSKISVFFGDDDSPQHKEPVKIDVKKEIKEVVKKDTVPTYNKAFFKANNMAYKPERNLNIPAFDSLFKKGLKKNNVVLPYKIAFAKRGYKPQNDTIVSSPFLLEFTHPVIYCVHYNVPMRVVLISMLPYLLSTGIIFLLLTGSVLFLYNTYKLQMQQSQFRENLLGNITHELKTPLSSLQLIIDSVSRSATGNEEVIMPSKYIAFAGTELDRMKLLVDRILSFSKMNREQLVLDKQQADLSKVINDAIKIMEIKTLDASGKVNFNDTDSVVVLGDPLLLTNAVSALIDNALKYTKEDPNINIHLSREGKYAVISVQDNGIGISRKYRKKVFDPFFRVQAGNVYNSAGHGLGLSFVKQVAELHDGSISFTSDNGTIFYLRINIS